MSKLKPGVIYMLPNDPVERAKYIEQITSPTFTKKPCKTCVYFEPNQISPDAAFGQCRIGPPVARNPGSTWPLTHPEEGWCGAHKPIKPIEQATSDHMGEPQKPKPITLKDLYIGRKYKLLTRDTESVYTVELVSTFVAGKETRVEGKAPTNDTACGWRYHAVSAFMHQLSDFIELLDKEE